MLLKVTLEYDKRLVTEATLAQTSPGLIRSGSGTRIQYTDEKCAFGTRLWHKLAWDDNRELLERYFECNSS